MAAVLLCSIYVYWTSICMRIYLGFTKITWYAISQYSIVHSTGRSIALYSVVERSCSFTIFVAHIHMAYLYIPIEVSGTSVMSLYKRYPFTISIESHIICWCYYCCFRYMMKFNYHLRIIEKLLFLIDIFCVQCIQYATYVSSHDI